jgi:hypothetical protein
MKITVLTGIHGNSWSLSIVLCDIETLMNQNWKLEIRN